MIHLHRPFAREPEIPSKDEAIERADQILDLPTEALPDSPPDWGPGGLQDFYSRADYLWPDPDKPDGIPYLTRDGESNPGNFSGHRLIMRRMRNRVCDLATAWKLSGDTKYVEKAEAILEDFFLAEGRGMHPHLNHAQMVPGVDEGRGTGIIDTLHLVDVPFAIHALTESAQTEKSVFDPERYERLKEWFRTYLDWMIHHPHGIFEANTTNNHAYCYWLQVTVFGRFTDQPEYVEQAREVYRDRLLAQMASDGSFPLEIGRTKPYGYSFFIVDNLVSFCQAASEIDPEHPENDLWTYELPDGRGAKLALEYFLPYMEDRSSWPYPDDVMHNDSWPTKASFMYLAGYALDVPELIELWETLPEDTENLEVLRNLGTRAPWLWL